MMPTLKELRLQARLPVSKLAKLADVDRQTIVRAESGTAIQDVKAYAIIEALKQQLNQPLKMEDVTGLKIR